MSGAEWSSLVLGISLFLFGMNLMGESLKKAVGNSFRLLVKKMTEGRVRGCLFGALVTAMIQSSSATTVMTVGLVHAGTMTLSQAANVIVGANVGTAVTSWLTALSALDGAVTAGRLLQWLKPSSFTPFLALAGLLLYRRGNNEKKQNIGIILLGFSILMLGMDTMSEAVSSLTESVRFRSALLAFQNPFFGFSAGLVMTAVLQSSSASIGILQSLTVTGAIPFGTAIPIILGQNIGTCITAVIASFGTSRDAKRVACFHVLFNAIGSAVWMSVFLLLINSRSFSWLNQPADMWDIAGIHTLLKLLTLFLLLPFVGRLERQTGRWIREKKRE